MYFSITFHKKLSTKDDHQIHNKIPYHFFEGVNHCWHGSKSVLKPKLVFVMYMIKFKGHSFDVSLRCYTVAISWNVNQIPEQLYIIESGISFQNITKKLNDRFLDVKNANVLRASEKYLKDKWYNNNKISKRVGSSIFYG